MHKILIVEDEKGIRDTLKIFIKNDGYEVMEAANGKEGLAMALNNELDLIVADIMMPVMDGLEMTMKIREISDVPIIFLSAKSEDIDKIKGLNLGADDYITKPFEPMELLARIKSNLRRFDQIKALRNSAKEEHDNEDVLKVGDLCLDRFRKELAVNGKSVKLTLKEYQIMELLMSYPSRIFSSEEIYEKVWQELAINTETVIVHIRRLRKKIEVDPHNPRYLKVVWGIGYKVEGGNDEKR